MNNESNMHILLTGGTGLIGSALRDSLRSQGHQCTVLSRHPERVRDCQAIGSLSAVPRSERIDVIVNLAGAPIGKRWSRAYKRQLLASRVDTTKAVVDLIARLEHKPQLMISASAIGYYGSWDDEDLGEDSPAHEEFTHDLCRDWEREAECARGLVERLCVVRLGVVLAAEGGALRTMLPAFKLGLGGRIGSGKQYFSWVHIQDVVAALAMLIDSDQAQGIYNLTAPNPVPNGEFSRALGGALRRPALLPMPSLAVRALFGEMGVALLLNGQRVLPRRLQAAGFEFRYPDLDKALDSLQL